MKNRLCPDGHCTWLKRPVMTGTAMRYVTAVALIAGLLITSLSAAGETDSGIVAQWHFDEGSGKAVRDSSDNSNNGEFFGKPQWGKGVSGSAIALDGDSNVCVTTGRPLGIDKTATMEAWIKPEDTNGKILMKFTGERLFTFSCTGPRYGLPTRGLVFGIKTAPDKPNLAVDREVEELWDGKWHYVAVTCDGSMMKIYVDGRMDFFSAEQLEGTVDPGITPLYIGGYGQSPGRQFKGMIDEVTIWKRALTGEEIKQRYEKLAAGR